MVGKYKKTDLKNCNYDVFNMHVSRQPSFHASGIVYSSLQRLTDYTIILKSETDH